MSKRYVRKRINDRQLSMCVLATKGGVGGGNGREKRGRGELLVKYNAWIRGRH